MGKEICNNCGEEMEQVGKDTYYCQKCDKTFTIKDGKQFVAEKTNAIAQLKDNVKSINERLERVEEAQAADDTLCGF